jgi:hypothetical protein
MYEANPLLEKLQTILELVSGTFGASVRSEFVTSVPGAASASSCKRLVFRLRRTVKTDQNSLELGMSSAGHIPSSVRAHGASFLGVFLFLRLGQQMPRHKPCVGEHCRDDCACDHCRDQMRILRLIDDSVAETKQR